MNPLSPRSYGGTVPLSPRVFPPAECGADDSRRTATALSSAVRMNSLTNYPGTVLRVAGEKAAQADEVTEQMRRDLAKANAPPAGQRTPRMTRDPDILSLKAREAGGLGAKLLF